MGCRETRRTLAMLALLCTLGACAFSPGQQDAGPSAQRSSKAVLGIERSGLVEDYIVAAPQEPEVTSSAQPGSIAAGAAGVRPPDIEWVPMTGGVQITSPDALPDGVVGTSYVTAETMPVEIHAAVCQRPIHPFGEMHKLIFGKHTASNTGLVRDQY